MKAPLTIAIDGFSSCGKSTLAKDIARELDILYIDSGAMYRAVTYYLIVHKIDWNDTTNVTKALEKIDISFSDTNNKRHLILNGKDVEEEIRSPKVSKSVSHVAALSPVRRKLVHLQRVLAEGQSVVMDGRDIGTVVFPRAQVKFFVTADAHVRAERRFHELRQKHIPITREDVKENLKQRDHIDSTREDSPLAKAEDAIVLDNSGMNRKQQLSFALRQIKERISSLSD